MTRIRFLTLPALVAVMSATTFAADGIVQPASVQTMTRSYIQAEPAAYDYYDDTQTPPAPTADIEATPSDIPVPPSVPMVQDNGYTVCESGCREPWRLFSTTPRGFDVYGHIDVGATGNAANPLDNYNGPVTFNDRDEFQMNQAWITVKRDADNGGCGWAAGGRMDFLFGTDARFTQALGLEYRTDGTSWSTERFYQMAMPQLYGEVAYNDLNVKFGHYFTIIGYEVVNATENFFYSHAYTMQYGEPFTHTGMQFDYNPCGSQWTYSLGWNFGWDTFENAYNRVSALGGVKWTSYNERTTFAAALTTGDEPVTALDDRHNRTMYSVVLTQKLWCNVQYVFQHDFGWQDQGNIGVDGASTGDARWYGVNQYLFYDYNDCWRFGARAEWFRDNDGERVTSPPLVGANGFEGSFYEIAVGANWRPSRTTNLVIRPEVRFDWFHGYNKYDAGLQPFNDGESDNQTLFALDAILTY